MTSVIVFHSYYGCDTGCCGHTVRLTRDDGTEKEKFEFDHPGVREDPRAYAEEMVRDAFGDEHVADLDWDNCVIVDD